MTKTPSVECRNCNNLDVAKDPEGLVIRCSLGFYDIPGKHKLAKLGTPARKTPVYYSVLSLKDGNVGIYKAIRKCGNNYQPVTRFNTEAKK